MSSPQLLFSTRIVSVDSYMSDPVPGLDLCRSDFRKSNTKSVPVIRVFGSTPAGQTTCLHIHGVFPYLMVPYCGPDVMESHWFEIEQYMQQMAASLDTALNSASGKNQSNRQHVFKIVILRGISFYGYHQDEELFLKIYFYLPGDIKRAADLLQSGMVLGRQFQPHEAHVPYILQLFLDYNLYGMNLLHAKNCWFRLPIGKPDPITELPQIKRPDDIPTSESDGQESKSGETTSTSKDDTLGGKIQIPTTSQLENFNWNLLREKTANTRSQMNKTPTNYEQDPEDTDHHLVSSGNIRKISRDKDNPQANISQPFSCSDLCKSLLSKTLGVDSEESASETLTQKLCPLHVCWTRCNIPPAAKLPADVERHSTCDLEVDVIAADISNRDELSRASSTNPGIAAIWEDERARRRERDGDSQIPVDQSQPRVLSSDLSEKEAHYIQMMYDALDRYKEDNSLASSFDASLSFTASQLTRKSSTESAPRRRESKDMFASSGESASKSSKQDIEKLTPEFSTPDESENRSLTSKISQEECSLDEEDISTLDLMRKLEERDENEFSIATQRGNGPFDGDNERLTPEDFAHSESVLRRQLSISLSNSQHISSLTSSPDDTQPICSHLEDDDDDDVIEEFEMSQRWDSAIQDLLKDLSNAEIEEESDSNDVIPQLDGASDEPARASCAPTKRLGSTRRSCSSGRTKSSVSTNGKKERLAPACVNTRKSDGKLSKIVNTPTSKADRSEGRLTKSPSAAAANDTESMNAISSEVVTSHCATTVAVDKCTAVSVGAKKLARPSEKSCNMQLSSNKSLPMSNTSEISSKSATEDEENFSCADSESNEKTSEDSGGFVPKKKEPTARIIHPLVDSCAKKSKNSKVLATKDRSISDKSRTLAEMVESFVVVDAGICPEKSKQNPNGLKTESLGKDVAKSVLDLENKKMVHGDKKQDSKQVRSNKKSQKDTDSAKVAARNNVFDTIMKDNPGVVMDDQSSESALQNQLIHSTIVNLLPLPADNNAAVEPSNLLHSMVEITPTVEKPDAASQTRESRASRRCKDVREKDKMEKPMRARRSKTASKNSYLEDSIYETVFNSDWDTDDSNSYESVNTSGSRSTKSVRTRTKRSSNTPKRKKRTKQKVITKWIIVNRFKGMSNMKIGLWKIPFTKRVKLTPELLRSYELYSPTKYTYKNPPIKPPNIPPTRPRPMGKRSKHMLASLCPFGPEFSPDKKPSLAASPCRKEEKIASVEPAIQDPKPLSSVKNEKEPLPDTTLSSEIPSETALAGEQSSCSAPVSYATSDLSSVPDAKNCVKAIDSTSPILVSDRDVTTSICSEAEKPQSPKEATKTAETPILEKMELDMPLAKTTNAVEMEKVDQNQDPHEVPPSPKNDDLREEQQNQHLSQIPPPSEDGGEKMLKEIQSQEQCEVTNEDVKTVSPKNESSLKSDTNVNLNATNDLAKESHFLKDDDGIVGENQELVPQKNSETVSCAIVKSESSVVFDDSTNEKIVEKCREKPTDSCETEKSDADLIMKTHPILTSIFLKSKQPAKKSERKRNIKGKKEARKKKSVSKIQRNSPSPHDSYKDTKIMKSIVPVSSRTVEPLCNRISPEIEKNAVLVEDCSLKDVENTPAVENSVIKTPLKPSPSSKSKSLKRAETPKTNVVPQPVVSPKTKDIRVQVLSPEKKSPVIIVPSTKKVYSPSRKVTRNSVAVKLNSISSPRCMFTPFSDDSSDPWPPPNALSVIAFPPPHVEPNKLPTELPRPWSPKITHAQPVQQEQIEANDILEDFAESFGADATKMLGLVDDSVFKNMDCIDQLISDKDMDDKNSTSNLEVDSENFDKIFENVSSSAAASSKGSQLCKPSSGHLDEFEEETLLEFIDEMTSPTQLVESSTTQINERTFPTPHHNAMEEDSGGALTPQITTPSLQNCSFPVLPTLGGQDPQRTTILPPQRPATVFHSQNFPTLPKKNTFTQQQSWGSELRPHSCLPEPEALSPIPIARPTSALGHWPSRTAQSQPCLFNDNQMKEIRKNMSSPTTFSGFDQNRNLPTRQESLFYCNPNSLSQPTGQQVPSVYPHVPGQYQFPDAQGYADPSQVPRPASVMDQPLQVFHTHVHHHHHVHSINNPSGRSKSVADVTSPQPHRFQSQQQQLFPVKSEAGSDRVKVENLPHSNTPWPVSSTSGIPASDQTRTAKPSEKSKNKTQFYVPNSPFPYPKQPVTSVQMGPQGLLQTLTYIETSASEACLSNKSNFYAFAGVHPGPQTSRETYSHCVGGQNVRTEITSILLKGSCQIVPMQKTASRKKARKKVSQRGQKARMSCNSLPASLPTLDKVQTPIAKTPYGLMKQNSLNLHKKASKLSKVAGCKRKTISDFRAPPDTPTISLTGGLIGAESTATSEAFELSQDMFVKPSDGEGDGVGNEKNAETGCFYNFAFCRDGKNKASKSASKNLKLTISKNNVTKARKSPKKHQKRRNTAPDTCFTVTDPSLRPVPRIGEELVLNPVTGNWEIVPTDGIQKEVPLLLDTLDQTLPRSKANLGCQMLHEHSTTLLTDKNLNDRLYPLPTIPQHVSDLSEDDLKDFAVAKKRRKKPQKLPAEVKRASSTPEYMVSAVNFESSSPKLKLTLKKTPSRGKPKLSTLVTSTDIESVVPKCPSQFTAAKTGPVIIDPPGCSDDSDINANSGKKRIKKKNINVHSGSDSDFKIQDASSSTDDASEVEDLSNPQGLDFSCMNFQSHINAVKKMYTTTARRKCESVLVELNENDVRSATTAMDIEVPKILKSAKKRPRSSRPDRIGSRSDSSNAIQPLRSKCGRFISSKGTKEPTTGNKKTSGYKSTSQSASGEPPTENAQKSEPSSQTCLKPSGDTCGSSQSGLLTMKGSIPEPQSCTIGVPSESSVDATRPETLMSAEGCMPRATDIVTDALCHPDNSSERNIASSDKTESSCSKKTESSKKKPGNADAQGDGKDSIDELNHPDKKKPPGEHFLSLTGGSPFLYRTVQKPPSMAEVASDIKTLKLPIRTDYKELFYSDAADGQTTSHRLSNLPPYIRKPKAQKSIQDLSEYQTNLPLEGGLHHWTVLATASEARTVLENEVMRQKASELLPANVRVWDYVDVATKLPQYPALAKIFLNAPPGGRRVMLRPTSLPPSKKEVMKWLDDKREEELSKKCALTKKSCENKNVPSGAGAPSSPALVKSPAVTPSSHRSPLRRSISLTCYQSETRAIRRRRVSFDLTSVTQMGNVTSPTCNQEHGDGKGRPSKILKLETIKGSPAKPNPFITVGDKTSLLDKSSSDSKSLPFSYVTSPAPHGGLLDGTTSFAVSPSTLPSIQADASTKGSSSAIQVLVGSSGTDNTSPLTFLISGSFTPPPCSTQKTSPQQEGDELFSSLKKLPQSTPNVTGARQRKHVLRKLAFTPIAKKSESEGTLVSSYETSGLVSPTSNRLSKPPSQQTPTSKIKSLRKSVLSKKFQSADVADVSSPNQAKDCKNSSPLSLETPQTGRRKEGSQVDGPTMDNAYGFKAAQQHLSEAKSLHIVQHITTVSVELHVKTRIDLRPDPDMDEIRCLFFCLDSDAWTNSGSRLRTGIIIVDPDSVPKVCTADEPSTSSAVPPGRSSLAERKLLKKSGVTGLDVIYVNTEIELFLLFAQMMHKWDPDILVGYEVQMLSWGFLLQRAAHLRCDLCRAISRIPTDEQRNKYHAEKDVYGADNASELHIVGRIVLNLWRLMRTELALYDYSFESVAYHLLHERHPKYDHHTLSNWFDPPCRSGQLSHVHRHRVIDYFVSRVRGNMKLLQQQDLVDRTSELARLFGIQFYEVLTRGSQFRVESMLLRTARAHNLVAVTPGVLQRAQMRAPEVIALVMEPESKFYHVPVLVLDFQSLYPSMVIAHNICFSTCLGRAELLGSDAFFTFGCTSLRVPAKILKKLLRKNLITINPSGIAFVKSSVRRGVMPQMLDEILTTRIMVKSSMKKLGPDDGALKRMLDHRQLGLKLIANVTYGYTAANFSGRMPCVEVGDSIVHKARETLERAIHLVKRNSERWENARVVYGDTDSMFIALEGPNNSGCTKERAFEIGKEIAAEVTADNPTPVKLKFEKVYLPCVLETKKRYVGYAFETEDQKDPTFDAKGIETVRRDGTPATAKILEKMLKILFDTRDVSKVKEYVLKQCSKILDGRTTLKDCIIAKEYRGKQYYKPGAVVPALNIARKLTAMDKRAEPRVGERVPYVIVHGAPGTPLYQLVRTPLEVLKDPSLQLNGAYYVTKQVLPALDRVLSLLAVDVFLWHRYLPRTIHVSHKNGLEDSQNATSKKATISQFFKSKHCLMCKKLSVQNICDECLSAEGGNQQATAVSLMMEAKSIERKKSAIEQVCMQCTGATHHSEVRCVSLDCPILYKLHRAADEYSKTKIIRKALLNEGLL